MRKPQFGISMKLWLAPGFGILVLLAMSLYALSNLNRQDDALSKIWTVRFQSVAAANHAGSRARDVQAQGFRYLSAVRASYSAAQIKQQADAIDASIVGLKSDLAAMAKAAPSDAERGLIAEASKAVPAYEKGLRNALDLADSDISTATTMMEPATKAHTVLIAALDTLIAEETHLSELAYDDAHGALRISVQVFVSMMVAAVVTCSVITFLARRSIMRSILSLREAALRLSAGDLTRHPAEFANDELGDTGRALQETLGNLRDIVQAIQETSSGTTLAASEIAAGTSDLSQRTEVQAASLQVTSTTMQGLNQAVQKNAQAARELESLAHSTSRVADRGGVAVEQVTVSMHSISDASKGIREITSLIDSIAFQTNILALNASIEAARAGELGKGFAVVAGEVRTLAARSAAAAAQIRELVSTTSQLTTSGTELVGSAGEIMKEVVRSIQQLGGLITTISSASAQQAADIGMVDESLAAIDHGTQQNAALVEQAAAASSSLTSQTERLTNELKRFRVDDAQPA